ncbi:hypothetical protein LCGC14_1319020 [marine sediment metagenome]|uniref:Uncharacterized protein n=1 Tax=marine sediment metagenome TaxID=412755 RepID=A0A0F9KK19_9ZZZZ|nr:MAG: hypothetical protein Lokiarch_34660 [Candidatus Lokiarchaeum sp. GC14_75]
MKKERTIIIKTPRLKKIRSNLRLLWLEAFLAGDLKDHDEGGISTIRRSICECAAGGGCSNIYLPVNRFHRTDLDMGYVPFLKQWYCIDCFNWIKKHEDEFKKEMDPNYITH